MKFILLLIAIVLTGACFAQEGNIPQEPKFPQTPIRDFLHNKKFSPGFPNKIVVLKDRTVLTDLNKAKLLTLPNSPQVLVSPANPGALELPGTPRAKFLGPLPNGNLVYSLPQDNMPCVVPNENGMAYMPNAISRPAIPYRYKGPGAIPNPAQPIQLEKPKK